MTDTGIKENIVKVQELIKQAPGNAGGAEMIIKYYKDLIINNSEQSLWFSVNGAICKADPKSKIVFN